MVQRTNGILNAITKALKVSGCDVNKRIVFLTLSYTMKCCFYSKKVSYPFIRDMSYIL